MSGPSEKGLAQFVEEFGAELPNGSSIRTLLDRAELTIRRAEPTPNATPDRKTPRTWLFWVEPANHIRQRFDLAPEILVLIIPADTAQARDIYKAEKALLRDYRLDRSVVFVLTRQERAASNLDGCWRSTGRAYVFSTFAQIETVSDPQQWLTRSLLSQLGSADLFAPGPPVFGWDFRGRKQETNDLLRHLRGGRPVGLYGLRKVGKTSLILFARRRLLEDSVTASEGSESSGILTVPIHLDLLRISFAERNLAGFMRQLILAAYSTLQDLGLEPSHIGLRSGLNNLETLRRLSSEETEREGIYLLETLVEWACKAPGERQVLLFVDEYERLLSGDQEFPRRDGLAILEFLRGLVQTYPKAFNFLIAGLTRKLASTPLVEARQNPLFNFTVDFPLAGLSQMEMNELVGKIGRRLFLSFSSDALELIWEETGGHPYLARALGRLVDKSIPTEARLPKTDIRESVVRNQLDRFHVDVLGTMEEVAGAVAKLDPEAPTLLAYLETYPEECRQAIDLLGPEVVEELQRLGILTEKNGKWRTRIGCFGRWLRANHERAPSVASGA